MFYIEYEVIDYRKNHVGNKTLTLSKKDFMVIGEFLTKVNKLSERTSTEIQKLLIQDEAMKMLIRKDHWADYSSLDTEDIKELDNEIQYCINEESYSDEYYHLIYSYLDIEAESSMGDSMYYLGKTSFYESSKGKDYEYTF